MSTNDTDDLAAAKAGYRSRFGRFSPSMGWKAFWSEIIIVILGVLIALAANEAVQNWNWQNKVRNSEVRLRGDLEYAFEMGAESIVVAPCVDAQLVAMANNLLKDGNALQALPRYSDKAFQDYVVRYPDRPFVFPVWDALVADGTVTHIPEARQKAYQEINKSLSESNFKNSESTRSRGRFAVMAYPIALDTVVRKDLLIEIEEQRSRYKSITLGSKQAMQQIDNLHMAPKPETVVVSLQDSGTVSFCKAHGYPLADWRDALKPEAR